MRPSDRAVAAVRLAARCERDAVECECLGFPRGAAAWREAAQDWRDEVVRALRAAASSEGSEGQR